MGRGAPHVPGSAPSRQGAQFGSASWQGVLKPGPSQDVLASASASDGPSNSDARSACKPARCGRYAKKSLQLCTGQWTVLQADSVCWCTMRIPAQSAWIGVGNEDATYAQLPGHDDPRRVATRPSGRLALMIHEGTVPHRQAFILKRRLRRLRRHHRASTAAALP